MRPFFRLLACVSCLCALTGFSATDVVAAPLGVLVPAYFYPGSDSADWNRMCSAATQIPLMAVMNPDNGPGRSMDTNYLAANINLDACGGSTLGYVHTQYGKRPLSDVKRDVRRYFDWYQPDGIFIDEMSSSANPTTLRYYRALAAYIRSVYPQAIIVGNPGTAFSEAFARSQVADVFVDAEDTATNVNATPQAAWTRNYPAALFAEIAIATPSGADGAEASFLSARNLGWVYSTSRGAGNTDPYAGLPDDFEQEVAALIAANAAR